MPSKIEYVDETWNPMTGCTKISAGCENCYAERMARRLAGRFGYPEAPCHFDVMLHPNRLHEPQERKKPTRYLTCSMGDLFHNDLSLTHVAYVWTVMAFTPRHTFLVLTKRPARMAKFIEGRPRVLPNVWLGVTVESQDQMWRVEELLKIPAAKRWVSLEPMLGPIDISDYVGQLMRCDIHGLVGRSQWTTIKSCCLCVEEQGRSAGDLPLLVRGASMGLDWIVLGGETGPGARPCHPDWIREVRDHCVAAGVSFFFKGWGAWFPRSQWEDNPDLILPDDCDCIEGHSLKIIDGDIMHRVGKKAAGRLLDGQTWDEMLE